MLISAQRRMSPHQTTKCVVVALAFALVGCASNSADHPTEPSTVEPQADPVTDAVLATTIPLITGASLGHVAQFAAPTSLLKETPHEPPPQAETILDPSWAETEAGSEVLRTLIHLRDNITETRYTGRLRIDPENGVYRWDCSGMAAWILLQSAPKARKRLKSSTRPLAKKFYRAIEKAPTDGSKRGWQQLEHISDARPGDLFSWLRSPISKTKITGHIGFFVEQPRPLEDHPHIYKARIADSTSIPHGNDTRARDGDGGFGFGTLLFVTDESGETVAYGWHGMNSLGWGYMPARVIYGRVTE